MIEKILNVLLYPFRAIRDEYKFRKRLKELRKKDPFNYK